MAKRRIPPDYSRRIAELREQAGPSQTHMAERIGVTPATVSRATMLRPLPLSCDGQTACVEALPWPTVRRALDQTFNNHFLERTVDSGPWPCTYAGAANVRLRVPSKPPPPPPPPAGVRVAEAELETHELQDLADVGNLVKATAGYSLGIRVRIELAGDPPDDVVQEANDVLFEVGNKLKLER
jgi:hypothetical protein